MAEAENIVLPDAWAENLLPRIARQNALGRPLDTIEGSPIYAVSQPWEKAYLPQDEGIITVRTAAECEEAMQRGDGSALFIPLASQLTLAFLIRILRRSGLSRTIFMET